MRAAAIKGKGKDIYRDKEQFGVCPPQMGESSQEWSVQGCRDAEGKKEGAECRERGQGARSRGRVGSGIAHTDTSPRSYKVATFCSRQAGRRAGSAGTLLRGGSHTFRNM